MTAKVEKNIDKEFNYYLDHQEELVKKYDGKFLIIKDQRVVGSYDTSTEAYTEGEKSFKIGTFLIQFCSAGPASYTQTFHSRVIFN